MTHPNREACPPPPPSEEAWHPKVWVEMGDYEAADPESPMVDCCIGIPGGAGVGRWEAFIPESIATAREQAAEERGREQAMGAVMDLYFAIREIGGAPVLKDLLKLARRIRPDRAPAAKEESDG
jgi:hypothetical protein